MASLRDVLDPVFVAENAVILDEICLPLHQSPHEVTLASVEYELAFGGVMTTQFNLTVMHATDDVTPYADLPTWQHRVYVHASTTLHAVGLMMEQRDAADEQGALVALRELVGDVLRHAFQTWNAQALLDADWAELAHGLK